MTKTPSNPDITVRGGIINYPHSTSPTQPPRHQPNTPPIKKKVIVKPDHQVHAPDPDPTKAQPKPPSAAPPEPAAHGPEGETNNVPVETS